MRDRIVFLVVPATCEAEFEKFARDSLAYDSRSFIRILTDAQKRDYKADIRENVTNDIIESLSAYNNNHRNFIFLHRDTKCNIYIL